MSAKSVNKSNARKSLASAPKDTGKSTPYRLSDDQSSMLRALVDATTARVGAQLDELGAFCEFIRSLDWSNRACFDVAFNQLGEACIENGVPAQGVKYCTMLNNCWKIANGGKKGEITVQGYGIAHMKAMLGESHESINGLSKALSDGKPEALKPAGGTRGASKKKNAKPPVQQAGNIVAVKSAADAYRAALQVLSMVTSFMKPSDHELLKAYETCAKLTQAKIDAEVKSLAKAA